MNIALAHQYGQGSPKEHAANATLSTALMELALSHALLHDARQAVALREVGKLSPELLERYIFQRVGVRDPSVLVGPAYGEDSAIIDMGDFVLVAHSNPITEAVERIGWLAVHVACNDVAVRGARPRWLLPVILLPEGCSERAIDEITAQIDEAAREVGAMVVGGHTERTPGLRRPVISMTALGRAPRDRFVRTGGARPGDVILMTKGAAVEGTAILATDFAEELARAGVSERTLEKARSFMAEISVVPEALALAEVGVNSMHDPTEGGLLGGLAEIAYASGRFLEIWEERVLIRPETRAMCNALAIDPLKLISSGCLLATLPSERLGEAEGALAEVGVDWAIIGHVRDGPPGLLVHRADGRSERVGRFVEEELARLWAELR